MKDFLHQMLHSHYKAQVNKALLSLELLQNHAVGIGDHSTEDFYKNAIEALSMLDDAKGKLATLDEWYRSTQDSLLS